MSECQYFQEIGKGKRFEFGKNWQRFLSVLNDDRIIEAEKSLQKMLGLENLTGKSFLDIGSGSGLFSLAAMRLGARRIHSFDFDPQSVACTQKLKERYFPNNNNWTVEEASVLDGDYLKNIGQWDIVYSWGVLHHTGKMWQALKNLGSLVNEGGSLFISIYNDLGCRSKIWRFIKHFYCLSFAGKILIIIIFIPYFVLRGFASDILKLQNPIFHCREYKKSRGMSMVHDWFDWLGGYPFEVAKPEEIFNFYKNNGFILEKLKTCGCNHACNEYVFLKESSWQKKAISLKKSKQIAR